MVDEPGAIGSFDRLSYAELAARAKGMALALDELGVEHGERVAIVSPNSGRFLAAFFGVSGYGRILVPINFRLTRDEIAYVVEHSGASVLLYDPDLADEVDNIKVAHRFRLDGIDDAALFAPAGEGAEPRPWTADEDATCSVNYTSGTTARPKGVQLTHRNCWLNAAMFGWHTGVSDRDVLLHTLPMFHCNGWGMPYAVTGMGGRHIVLRKVDGEEILARIEREGVTLMCGAPAVVAAILGAAETRAAAGREVPGRGTVRIVVAGAPPPSKTIERIETALGLGVHPDLRPYRDGAAADDQPDAGGVGRTRRRRALTTPQPCGRAGPRRAYRRGRRRRGAGPGPTTSSPGTGNSRKSRRRRSRAGGSTRATAGISTAPTP